MTKTGYFITIEGGEATGKTTQIEKLQKHFLQNSSYYFTREPGGSDFAEDKILPISELLLLNAARYDHIEKLIKPKLANNINIICDRFLDSTIAYQAAARGIKKEMVFTLHELITGNFLPDLTIILDLDPKVAIERVKKRAKNIDERFEKFPLEFHQKIRESFCDIANYSDRNFKIIDATLSPESIFAEIISAISSLKKD